MSAANSVSPPSATPSAPPQNQTLFPPPPASTSNGNTGASTGITPPQTQAPQPPLPPPQLFDILPPLHALLSRLEPSLNTYSTDPIHSHPSSLHPTSSTTTLKPNANTSAVQSSSGGTNALTLTTSHPGQEQLSYKDVVTTSQFLKARMRKAMAELAKLGDMDRGIDEQETEIAELEARIEGQKGVLGGLGERVKGVQLGGGPERG